MDKQIYIVKGTNLKKDGTKIKEGKEVVYHGEPPKELLPYLERTRERISIKGGKD